MSIDLEWLKLDSSLSTNLVTLLNRQLDTADRPSFIGPIKVTSLDFGSNSPDVELVDLRDIYRDFLEDDEDELERERGGGTFGDAVKVTEGGMGMDDDDGFEWVSRRAGVRRSNSSGTGSLHRQPSSQYLSPPGGSSIGGGSGDYFATASIPASTDTWNAGLGRPPNFADYGHGHGSSSPYRNAVEVPVYRSPSPSTPFAPPSPIQRRSAEELGFGNPHTFTAGKPYSYTSRHSQPQPPPQQEPPPNPHPNLQLHLHVNWHSNLRISLQTSLLINYPSPMFMSLPIRLSVTGLVFNGELAVAYEGERKRVHLCILDDLDPYGPAGARKLSNHINTNNANASNSDSSSNTNTNNSPLNPKPNPSSNPNFGIIGGQGIGITPPELMDDSILMGTAGLGLGGFNSSLGVGNPTLPSYIPPPPQLSTPSTSTSTTTSTIPSTNPTSTSTSNNNNPFGYNPTTYSRPTKPLLPIGQRLLPSIFIESEIGQADKHVLKNVTRVERFIQDVIRKTVEEELVFPNFHTLVMDPDA